MCPREIMMENKIFCRNRCATYNVLIASNIYIYIFIYDLGIVAYWTLQYLYRRRYSLNNITVSGSEWQTGREGERREGWVSGGSLKWKCQSCVMDDLNKPVMWHCWRYYIGYNFSVATSVFMRCWSRSIKENYKKSVVPRKLLGGRTYWIVMPCEHVRY